MTRIQSVFNLLKRVGFAVLLLLGSNTHAQDSLGIRRVDVLEYWQGAKDMEMRGDTLFAMNGASGLYILDVSDPANPIEIGRCPWYDYGDNGGGFDLVGNLAYIGLAVGGLVFDISDPTHPERIAQWQDYAGASDIFVAGDYAIGNTGDEGYPYVMDISDLSNIHSVIGLPGIGTEAWPMGVVGNYLFMAGHGLMVYDMTDPFAPEIVAQVHQTIRGRNGTIVGNYAYLNTQYSNGGNPGGVKIIDISNPLAPNTVATCDSGHCLALTITGNQMVISHGDSLAIWNIANPIIPVYQGSYLLEHEVESSSFDYPKNSITSSGEVVCVGLFHMNSAALIVDVSIPTSPVQVGEVGTNGWVRGFLVNENLGCLPGVGLHGFRTFDFSDPMNLAELGEPQILNSDLLSINSLEYTSGYLYATTSYTGMLLFDVRDPAVPESIGVGPPETFEARDVLTVGDLAYASTPHSLVTLDVSHPEAPVVVSAIPDDGTGGMQAINGYLFGLNSRTLKVFTLEDPTLPSLIGSYTLPWGFTWFVRGFAVSGSYAYIAYDDGGLRVIDISDPTNPTPFTVLPGQCLKVAVQEDVLVTYDQFQINVYNATDPLNMELVGYYEVAESIDQIRIADNYLVTASLTRLNVYELDALSSVGARPDFPTQFSLSAYPNPFNSTTTLRLNLPIGARNVTLTVSNILGQQVEHKEIEVLAPQVEIQLSADNWPSGIYLARAEVMNSTQTTKLVLLK